MTKRKMKKATVIVIYTLTIFVFGSSLYLIQKIVNNSSFTSDNNMEYVDKEIITDNKYVPVVSQQNTILKPYLNEEVEKSTSFYNYQDEASNQEKSIIYYENTYMQNSGIDYTNKEIFDIISILDGTVIEVSDNEILGKTIKIKHDNDLISTYQSLSEVSVKENDIIIRGQVIGKSGTCSLYSKDSYLHFELSKEGKLIDPETAYNKTQDEL